MWKVVTVEIDKPEMTVKDMPMRKEGYVQFEI
jgi:hypothetical protein